MMKKIFIISLLINFVSMHLLLAQSQNYRQNVSKRGTTVASFLEIGVGSRALAMGGAFTAYADDPSAIYWNPGALAKLDRSGVLLNHSQWIADTRLNFLAAAFRLGEYGTFGLGITALTMDEMEATTIEQPDGTGQMFGAGNYAVATAYAFNLTDRFSIGLSAKLVHEFIWEMSATGFAIDLGVHYYTPFKGIVLGLAMTNFGSKMRMTGDNTRVLYDYDPNSTGHNERIPANLETEYWALPLNFKIGLLYKALETENHKAFIEVDAQHPNNNYESLNLGIEYIFNDIFALRAGYNSLFLDDSEESLTLGTGLNYAVLGNLMFHIDYAFVDFGILENVHKFSVGLDF